MSGHPKRLLLALAATALLLSLIIVTPSQAATKTVTACVVKKTGAMTVQLGSKAKKKCPKGSSKVTWPAGATDGKNGTNGINGTNGTNGINGTNGTNAPLPRVLNADGTVLGTYTGLLSSGIALFSVLVDGGSYWYYPSGQVIPLGSGSPTFKNNACTGTAYVKAPPGAHVQYAGFVGSPSRVVFRSFNGVTFSPTSAWKFTTGFEVVSGVNVWKLDTTTGACTADGTWTGELISLASVPAPPDGIGPLTIG